MKETNKRELEEERKDGEEWYPTVFSQFIIVRRKEDSVEEDLKSVKGIIYVLLFFQGGSGMCS